MRPAHWRWIIGVPVVAAIGIAAAMLVAIAAAPALVLVPDLQGTRSDCFDRAAFDEVVAKLPPPPTEPDAFERVFTTKVEGARTTKVRDVPLGDEGFAQDNSVKILSSTASFVWLRIGALTIEVEVHNDPIHATRDTRAAAMSAARTVAAALSKPA